MSPPTDEQQRFLEMARLIKSVAHPVRFELLRTLAMLGKCGPRDLPNIGELSPLTLQQHLRELKKAGLVKGRIYGQSADYELNWERVNELSRSLDSFVNELREMKSDR
jgi:DNA-binding transcriptional ArsR family regulator